jgi:DNA-binding CsgD family transcriptional regulator
MFETQQCPTEPTTRDGTRAPSTRALTKKQCAVIRLVSLGCSVAEAAQILHISERTAENHKNRAMERLGIHKAALLTRFAIETGIAPVGDSLTNDEYRGGSKPPCIEIERDGDCDSRKDNNCATNS